MIAGYANDALQKTNVVALNLRVADQLAVAGNERGLAHSILDGQTVGLFIIGDGIARLHPRLKQPCHLCVDVDNLFSCSFQLVHGKNLLQSRGSKKDGSPERKPPMLPEYHLTAPLCHASFAGRFGSERNKKCSTQSIVLQKGTKRTHKPRGGQTATGKHEANEASLRSPPCRIIWNYYTGSAPLCQ